MSHGESIEEVVDRFLAHKRALGRKYTSAQSELRLLVRFCAERGMVGIGQLTPALLDEFLASRPRSRPKAFNHLLCVVRCLLDWAVAQQLIETSPLLRGPASYQTLRSLQVQSRSRVGLPPPQRQLAARSRTTSSPGRSPASCARGAAVRPSRRPARPPQPARSQRRGPSAPRMGA
jgi:hypothetical protein